ncbi:MAG: NDMA-dependent alcohol dehydrogenase, partial [Blastococcus sp.]|nr:NDMA-dependent alcohol dehydrogenase [Blastococcus sp.]
MKTKGAILWGVGEQWSVEEIEVGDPVFGEVTVELAASGLCHSDEHLVTGATPVEFPVIGGHEGAGVVTKVGPGVSGLKEGDHVVTAFIPACGVCPPCSRGQQNLCDLGAHLLGGKAISDGTNRVTAKGKGVSPMCLLGTFSPYITVNQASVVRIEPDIPLEIAALVGCGVTTGWGSATKVADVRPGENVVVMGAGGVGMNAVQGAAAAGAKRVIVIDPVAQKREWAMTLGATHTFANMEEATPAINELTWGRMAEKTIITVGDIQGEDVAAAMSITGKGGRAVVTGMGNFANVDVKLSLFDLTLMQKDLQGAIFGGLAPRNAIPELLSLYQEGQLKL